MEALAHNSVQVAPVRVFYDVPPLTLGAPERGRSVIRIPEQRK